MTKKASSKGIKCLRCNKRVEEVGCEVYHLDYKPKGLICSTCAAKPPRYRDKINCRAKGISRGKRRIATPKDLREVFNGDYDGLEGYQD